MTDLVVVPQPTQWHKLKALVLDSVSSPITKRVYNLGLDEFFAWFSQEPRPGGFTKATVAAWRVSLEARGLGAVSINVRITAVRKLAVEAADNGLLAPELAAGITRVKGVASKGVRLGNWLTVKQAQTLLNTPDASTTKGLRDRAILAVLLGCGLRRSECAAMTFGHVKQRDGRWCIVDLVGKHGRVRTIPMPAWVKVAIDAWTTVAGVSSGPVFRPVNRGDQAQETALNEKVVYRPETGKTDREGNEVEDRLYNTKDFDRTLVIDDRTKLVAKKVTEFLKESGDRFQKTIVFCVDEEHAARMRQALVNENKDLCDQNYRYVMRITGSDTEGQAQLGNFIDPESKYPVLVTTSRLLSTGVDAQTCRLIVLDRPVGSMTEFKQIVGRGTRVHEDTKKFYFTLIDFRGATNHFADPLFDGPPEQIYEPGEDDPMMPPDDVPRPEEDDDPIPAEAGTDETVVDGGVPDISIHPDAEVRAKVYVDGIETTIIAERVEYLDENGRLVTESLRDFSKKALKKRFTSLDEFLRRWRSAERKQAIIEELESEGLPLEPLAEEVGRDLDPFDLICHVAFDQPPLTRRERAENVRKRNVFTKYGPQARAVLEALLQKYQDQGVINLDDPRVLQISPFDTMGTPLQLIKQFGTRADFERAVHEMQTELYTRAA